MKNLIGLYLAYRKYHALFNRCHVAQLSIFYVVANNVNKPTPRATPRRVVNNCSKQLVCSRENHGPALNMAWRNKRWGTVDGSS